MSPITKLAKNGVMLNAYPDSIGRKLSDAVKILQRPEFNGVFSLFYILPTFFNSDLDRGFSIIDYDLNKELVSEEDLKAFEALNIQLKFDIVLNHLSVASPQFKDVLKNGKDSKYKDFFINWNDFWQGHGNMDDDGVLIPKEELIRKLFMRKPGLPILKVPFPDNSKQPYWNTFYQKKTYNKISIEDLKDIIEIGHAHNETIVSMINAAIEDNQVIHQLDFSTTKETKQKILNSVERNCTYLGQMDLNANSELVWNFYEETLAKLKGFGCTLLRLDAFAYLHKEVGQTNFFNIPGTWDYLGRLKAIANSNDLSVLPEIHAEYGSYLHKEVADNGYQIYDFFLPGLLIHTLEKGDGKALIKWAKEIVENGYNTINMLGCHDGIPVLDLKGKEIDGIHNKGLLSDEEIEDIMGLILDRGGRVKNLYDAEGNKISYYQVNATYYSALGEVDQKLLLARAIQLFMPGIPQVWYLDIFAGTNDYEAVKKAGEGGHKEINRTNLSLNEIEIRLTKGIVKHQLELIKLRNTSKAFLGTFQVNESPAHEISMSWTNNEYTAHLKANLIDFTFTISYSEKDSKKYTIQH